MLSNPVFNRFHLYFSRQFLIPSVRKKFQRWFDRQTPVFDSMIAYVNDSIYGVDIPQMSTQVVDQTSRDGSKRHYAGSLSATSSIKKSITVSFKIRNNFFTYFLMRSMFVEFIDRRDKNTDFILPHITLDIIDQYGYVIFTQNYHGVVFESISSISLKKNENGFSYREFTCTFRYNSIEEVSPLEEMIPLKLSSENVY